MPEEAFAGPVCLVAEARRGGLLPSGCSSSATSRKKLDEIISARLSDIFELIDLHLKKINRNGLLPAGIVITGGGSNVDSITEQAKNLLKLPSRIAELSVESLAKTQIKEETGCRGTS